MKYCKSCGSEVNQNDNVCSSCGAELQATQQQFQQQTQQSNPEDTGGFGWGLLGFCIPLAGLILFIVWHKERPLTAKAAGIGAIIGIVLNIITGILYAVGLAAGLATGMY